MTCATCIFFVFQRERDTNSSVENPYRTRVHKCACCTWCVGFFYAILAFAVGGLLVFAVVPLSGACLVLDDLNSDILFNAVPGASFDSTGDGAVMTRDIIEKCLNPKDVQAATNANLLDILYMRENGTKVTFREKIMEQIKDKITSKFELIEEKLNS